MVLGIHVCVCVCASVVRSIKFMHIVCVLCVFVNLLILLFHRIFFASTIISHIRLT